ncbi:MAG: PLP-dependent aminotransferase family protein [Vicinamibacterales bacterium]
MDLQLDGIGPLYQQLARAITGAIEQGQLVPGARLPSTRELAAAVGCSRNIALMAYRQLLGEGYLLAYEKAGTYVSPDLPVTSRPAGADAVLALAPAGEQLVRGSESAEGLWIQRSVEIDFRGEVPAPDPLLTAAFRRALGRAVRADPSGAAAVPAGEHPLRRAVADRLARRGLVRGPDTLVITGGLRPGLDLICRLFLSAGDLVVMEDPGYARTRAMFESAGARVQAAPVDGGGLNPAALPRDPDTPVRLLHVTPAHQFPTGAVLTAARRRAILDWASAHDAFVVEDDRDGDLRHHGVGVPLLAGADRAGRVILCADLAPALARIAPIGCVALPGDLAQAAAAVLRVVGQTPAPLSQRAIGELLATGEYDTHVRRVVRGAAAAREVLADAVAGVLGGDAEVSGAAAGTAAVVWLPHLAGAAGAALEAACESRGVGVRALSRYSAVLPRRAALLMDVGGLRADAIVEGVRRIADAYRQVRADGSC